MLRTLTEFAPAKINLTLAVKGRRADGFHELASLVAFASVGDELSLVPDGALSLEVDGPFAAAAGEPEGNLVLKAAKALARRVTGLNLGAFFLHKQIPVAAGLGGGSADAAAALRLLARLNGLPIDGPAVTEAAAATGSDVRVCLAGGCRMMRGRGEILGPALSSPVFAAVLVNPGIRLETARVFAAFAASTHRAFEAPGPAVSSDDWLHAIAACGNDLEAPAIGLEPAIDDARREVAGQRGCLLARMTGSGATVIGIFEQPRAALAAAHRIAEERPKWWVREAMLGG